MVPPRASASALSKVVGVVVVSSYPMSDVVVGSSSCPMSDVVVGSSSCPMSDVVSMVVVMIVFRERNNEARRKTAKSVVRVVGSFGSRRRVDGDRRK